MYPIETLLYVFYISIFIKIHENPESNLPLKRLVLKLRDYLFLKCNFFRADLNNTKFYIGIKIPFLTFDAQYDVNARILVVPLKGKGPINANASKYISGKFMESRRG